MRPFFKTLKSFSRMSWIHLSGNIIDHFDTALYGFMVPVLGPLFFPHHDTVGQWIMGYGLMCASWITRPLGGFLWARYADRHGALWALSYVLLGMSLFTATLGFLPTYSQAGVAAPFCLMLCRAAQSFCAAGESVLAPLTVLDTVSLKQRSTLSGAFHSSTVWGCMLASAASMWVLRQEQPALYWRYPFWVGSLIAVPGVMLRFQRAFQHVASLPQKKLGLFSFRNQISTLCCIGLISTVGWVTYSLSFILLNTLVPLVQPQITVAQMMTWSTGFLVLDALMLPYVGRWLRKRSPVITMRCIIFVLAFSVIFGVGCLSLMSMTGIMVFRVWIILLGVTYTVVFNMWMHRQKEHWGYASLALGSSMGTEILGRSIPWVGLCLFKWSTSPWPVGIYLAALCGCAFWALKQSKQTHARVDFQPEDSVQ